MDKKLTNIKKIHFHSSVCFEYCVLKNLFLYITDTSDKTYSWFFSCPFFDHRFTMSSKCSNAEDKPDSSILRSLSITYSSQPVINVLLGDMWRTVKYCLSYSLTAEFSPWRQENTATVMENVSSPLSTVRLTTFPSTPQYSADWNRNTWSAFLDWWTTERCATTLVPTLQKRQSITSLFVLTQPALTGVSQPHDSWVVAV